MDVKKFRPVLETTVLSVFAWVLHELLFHFFFPELELAFRYKIAMLYGFFFTCSLVIVFILIQVRQKNIDSVGNTFMLLTCIKMVIAYILLHPILQLEHAEVASEKTNFFAVFALFLVIETLVTIGLLNRK
jgi:hypothetical protein